MCCLAVLLVNCLASLLVGVCVTLFIAYSCLVGQGMGEDPGNGNLLLENRIGPDKYMGNAVSNICKEPYFSHTVQIAS